MFMSWRKASILLLAFLGTCTDAWARDWIYFNPMRGEVSIEFDGRWRQQDDGTSSYDVKLEEHLLLNISGAVVDPRILQFNIDLEPTFTQRQLDTGIGIQRDRETDLNYGGAISLLRGLESSPLSLDGDFQRSTSDLDGALGSRSSLTTDRRGVALNWRSRALPTTIKYREFFLDEFFVPGFGQLPSQREEFFRRLSLSGANRKMRVVLEGIEFDDRTALDNDYDSQEARLDNNFRWGKGSTLASKLRYFNRIGFNAEEKSSIDESLVLRHTENLSTTYRFAADSTERTTSTDERRVDLGLNHRLYTNLTTRLNVSWFNTDSEEFEQDRTDATLDFGYRKKFDDGPTVTANLGGGYRVIDRIGGRIDFSESPTVPPTGVVVLAQRYIDQSTIVVTAPGCNPCIEGPANDYIVEDAGNDFTQLRIPAGSRINIGDTITVDYVYEPPDVEYYGIPYRFGLRLDYGRFALFHRTDAEDQTFIEGPDPEAIADRRNDTTGAQLNWTWGRNESRLSAERLFTMNGDFESTEYVVRHFLKYGLAPDAILVTNLSASYLTGDTEVTVFRGDGTITWFPVPLVRVKPNASAFHRTSSPGGTEGFLEVGVDVAWSWRRLILEMEYDHTLRENQGATTNEDRLFMKVTRKF